MIIFYSSILAYMYVLAPPQKKKIIALLPCKKKKHFIKHIDNMSNSVASVVTLR